MTDICRFTLFLQLCWCLILPNSGRSQSSIDLDSILQKARVKYDLPAIGAALIIDGEVQHIAVTGVRKYGDTTKVTAGDTWHLGSCTKAFTATLIARLVDVKKVDWKTTICEVFPEMKMNKAYRYVTIEMLLCHFGGVPSQSWPTGMSLHSVEALQGSPREQRYEYVSRILRASPEVKPGTKLIYSNAGMAIAGAMVEELMNSSFEDLMAEYVFQPLGITSAGYGAMNTQGLIDEPWQHTMQNGKHVPIGAGPGSDNPPAITPAGRIHLSLADWSRFAMAHLFGADSGSFLKRETWEKIHSLPFGGDYGFGWIIIQRQWAGGTVLTHDGSNTQNYSSIWLAPKKEFALMIVINQGNDAVEDACQKIVGDIVAAVFRH